MRDVEQAPSLPAILALFSDVGGYGGMQTYSRRLLAAIEPHNSVQILGLNDPEDRRTVPGLTTPIRGFGRKKVAFSLAAIRASRGKDIVLVGHPNFGSLIPFLGSQRVAVLLYGNDGWKPLAKGRRTGLRRARAVGAISEHTLARSINQQRINPAVTFLLEPALGSDLLPIRASLRRSANPRVLTVTRLDAGYRYKGVDEVLRALPALIGKFPDLEYVIVGDGDDVPRLRSVALELGVQNHVRFAGFIDEAELSELYASSHAFTLMSSEEGFGLVFLEAMAHGLPIVAASEGAAPDVLDHGRAGVLVPKGDIGALEGALTALLSDPLRAAELARAGRSRVASNYLPEHFEQRVNKTLTLLLPADSKVASR